jgi:hypothetical protein
MNMKPLKLPHDLRRSGTEKQQRKSYGVKSLLGMLKCHMVLWAFLLFLKKGLQKKKKKKECKDELLSVGDSFE